MGVRFVFIEIKNKKQRANIHFFCRIPVILVAAVCLAGSPDYSLGSSVNPNFQFGSFQAAVTLFLLSVTFVGKFFNFFLKNQFF